MESWNKSKLTDVELQAIIYQAFSQSYESARELSDGWANTAYSIVLSDGRAVVLKVAPSHDKHVMRCEKNNMKTEVEVLRMVGSTEGLPVPRIYTYDPSYSLIPSEYFIMEHIQGVPYNKIKSTLTHQEIERIEQQLGVYSRSINAYRGSSFGYFAKEDGCHETWSEAFQAMIGDVLTDGIDADVILPVSYAEIEREISRKVDTLVDVKEACLVHWDLWDGNIFIHEGRISGIVDFERAFWGEPLIEYYFGRLARASAFQIGYGKFVLTDSERRRRALYDLYLDLILVIECAYRKYDNPNHIKWVHENFNEGLQHLRSL